ncbi:molybdate ABC transporter substrate-binding protein [Roseiflexus sp.]|uniref:molybdate ABC transporter substrate-binding protein n=1 Tax=Roseiflexus sp. TaxID=2562120 RepID=UPI0021DDC552|nr:molybdate ABC transporter substrate-binding protein [Roseiflexus sp.]GIW01195.1 MAG: molybdate ABC transporter substrate-binding protein [Roseiflexus sp.]
MQHCRHVLILIALLLVASGCSAAPAPLAPLNASSSELVVAAAADLTPAFQEIGKRFEEQTGIRVAFNFGSTGQLAQQIERGAPFDLFYAANKSFIEELNAKGMVIPDTIELYAQGRITLWTRPDSPLKPERVADLVDPVYQRIAIANPEHAPYGQAAKEALERAGVWEKVQPRLVFGENVAQTLTLADTGNVDVAIVALSLSVQGNGNWTLIPAELHPDHPLLQMAAVVAGTPREQEARRFIAFVNSPEGHAIMKKHGFILPGEIVSR